MPMLTTITLSLFALVIVNLLLLKYSCNKIIKPSKANKKPVTLKPELTILDTTEVLAPTGS